MRLSRSDPLSSSSEAAEPATFGACGPGTALGSARQDLEAISERRLRLLSERRALIRERRDLLDERRSLLRSIRDRLRRIGALDLERLALSAASED